MRQKHPFHWPNGIRSGFHLSIALGPKGLFERFSQRRCQALQIFVGSPRVWKRTPWKKDFLQSFQTERTNRGQPPLIVHSGYLINLASTKEEVREKSVICLQEEYELAKTAQADHFVLHMGSNPDFELGLGLMAKNLARSLQATGRDKPLLLLENTAGEKNDLGSRLADLQHVIDQLPFPAGICFDTCHGFQAGYGIHTASGRKAFQKEVETSLTAGAIRVIHLNDSLKPFSSGHDRHQHIGQGHIGAGGLAAFLQLPVCRNLPVILETPQAGAEDDSFDRKNLDTLWKAMNPKCSPPKS